MRSRTPHLLSVLTLLVPLVAGAKTTGDRQRLLLQARTLVVQYQDLDESEVRRVDPDVLVVDYAWDGDKETELLPGDVSALKSRPDRSRRLVLAYMSVGEAETYRFYWLRLDARERRALVVKRNPRFADNLVVRFWLDEWHSIIYRRPDSLLSRILLQGFDGVLLDRVDAATELVRRGHPQAAEKMAELVVAIAQKARERDKEFLVVAQNPDCILGFSEVGRVLSGIALDARMACGRRVCKVAEALTRRMAGMRTAGKAVFVIECSPVPRVLHFLRGICHTYGLLCYVGPRALDRLGVVIGSDSVR